jgi:hypothetical protein
MTIDYWDAPLGLNRKPQRSRVTPIAWGLLSGLFGVGSVLFPTWATLGARVPEPDSVMTRAKPKSIDQAVQENSLPEKSIDARSDQASEVASNVRTITIIDGKTGAREEIKIFADGVHLPNAPPPHQSPTTAMGPATAPINKGSRSLGRSDRKQ